MREEIGYDHEIAKLQMYLNGGADVHDEGWERWLQWSHKQWRSARWASAATFPPPIKPAHARAALAAMRGARRRLSEKPRTPPRDVC